MSDPNILHRIKAYKRKYFASLLLRGILIGLGTIITIFLVVNFLEYMFQFGYWLRALMLFVFITSSGYVLFKYIGNPLFNLLNNGRSMSEEQAAMRIGKFFPNIADRLLNLIQLEKMNNDSALMQASISQRSAELRPYEFSQAVNPREENIPYLKYALVPLGVLLLILILQPSFIAANTQRILFFNRDFIPKAPFSFGVNEEDLKAYRNEDYTLTLHLEGESVPAIAYLIDKDRRIKLTPDGLGNFTHTYQRIQYDKDIRFEAAGYFSDEFDIEVVDRPDLKGFDVSLQYPAYLGRKNERLSNTGNLQVPEGTNIEWLFNTLATDSLSLLFNGEEVQEEISESSDQVYTYDRTVSETADYEIKMFNEHGTNKDAVKYRVFVTRDAYPDIRLEQYQDTTLFQFVAFRGMIQDDYGLSNLRLYYKLANTDNDYTSVSIPIGPQPNQRFYYQWDFDSLLYEEGASLEYFMRVWDNDGVNGAKSTKTATYTFRIPGKEEISDEIERMSEKTKDDVERTLEKAQDLENQIEEAEEKLRSKRDLDWQDEQMIKEILKQREELNEELKKLQEEYKNSLEKMDRFDQSENKQLREKAEKIRELMDELLDDETRKLYEELQKLLEEQRNTDEMRDKLGQLNQREKNLEKELERAFELLKRWKLEQKIRENLGELNDLKSEQEDLAEKTEESDASENQELIDEQEELQEKFEEIQENMDAIQEMNQELKRPESLPDTEQEQQEIQDSQEKSKESLEQKQNKKSGEQQRNATQQMQQMQEKMQQMQSGMEMQAMMENMDDLRDIMHNLLKLSFDQESLIDEFREVQQSDPRFVDLGQNQLKIRDDARIVEDSLLSLANRVFQIQSFVTREVSDMNKYLDNSMEGIRERKKQDAVVAQQFAMTSMNNLALLLDDVMQQMQQAMSDAMGKGKPDKPQPMPSMSELQQQLNQKIEDLKNSGKDGRELSEELAKLAAEQERIRKAFEKMQEQIEQEGGQNPGQGIPEKMEETEMDLVNKEITQETIERQKEIMTRLLEAEDALRERDMDEERKGETAKDYEKEKPRALEEYFQMKEQEIEMLRTVPPKLFPYYKKEVTEYFKRLGEQTDTP